MSFDLAGAAKPDTAKAKLLTGGDNWYSCTTSPLSSPYTYSCATNSPQATLVSADELRIVAAD